MSKRQKNNPGYVTKVDCAEITSGVKGELKTIRIALVGEDMQGGLVQKVGTLQNTVDNLKKERENEHSLVREVLKTLVAPVIVAVVVAAIITGWHPW